MVRCIVLCLFLVGCNQQKRALVLSETRGYRHASIETGVQVVAEIARELDLDVITTEDSSLLCDEKYDVVVFLNTSGNILNEEERIALKQNIQSGCGFVGVHSAADTEYEWDWYGEKLLGAWFVSHPPVSESMIEVVNREHPSTSHLPEKWFCVDEWYVYDRMPDGATILMNVNNHPIAWCSEIGSGRSFYTGRGHPMSSFNETDFINHIKGGIAWVLQ
ncbi:MAG: Crp/Fnr family transcriptional regulator [Phycisphaerae bacterium]|nr:Crp/Fnr family transcriptional regulator [Phycisphaerae bacterium]